jgi:hypothetical protein
MPRTSHLTLTFACVVFLSNSVVCVGQNSSEAEQKDEAARLATMRGKARMDAEEHEERQRKAANSVIEVTAIVVQVLEEGLIVRPVGDGRIGPKKTAIVREIPAGTRVDQSTRRGMGTGAEYAVKKEIDARQRHQFPDLILVVDFKGQTYDGQRLTVKLWPAGTHRLLRENKTYRTLPKFTTEPDSGAQK